MRSTRRSDLARLGRRRRIAIAVTTSSVDLRFPSFFTTRQDASSLGIVIFRPSAAPRSNAMTGHVISQVYHVLSLCAILHLHAVGSCFDLVFVGPHTL